MVARKAGMAGIAVWRLNGEDAEMWTRTRPYAQSISEQPLTVELTQQQIANLGELATLSALLRPTTAAGASRSIANVPIQLQQQNPDMSWSDVATGITDATGAAVFSINAVLARFRISTQAVAGTWKSTTSAELLPAITRTIEITKQTATPTKKRGYKLSGIVSPAALDNPIELQRKVGRSWSTVATAALTQTGEFKLQWRKPPAGITALRLTSAAAENYPAVLIKLGKVTIK